jgi:hypothetical protein
MSEELVERLISFERKLATKKGRFNLFMLLLREELTDLTSAVQGGPPGRWDVVAAASWIYEDKKKNFEYFSKELRAHLGLNDILAVSRMVLLRPEDAFVEAVNKAFKIEHGNMRVSKINLFGIHVNQAYIITSRKSKTTPKESVSAKK